MGTCDCGCCMYGPYTVLPLVLGAVALGLSWLVAFDCRFFESTTTTPDGRELSFTVGPWTVQDFNFFLNGGPIPVPPIEVPPPPTLPNPWTPQQDFEPGLGNLYFNLTWDTDDYCVAWSEHDVLDVNDQDSYITFVRIITMIVALGSAILYFFMLLTACMRMVAPLLWLFAFCCFGFGFLIGWSLLLPLSDFCTKADECTVHIDAIFAVAAVGVWIFTGVSVIYLPGPKYWKRAEPTEEDDAKDDEGTTTETVEEVTDDKGKVFVVTTATTVYENGNTDIVETREPKIGGSSVRTATSSKKIVEEDDEAAEDDPKEEGGDAEVVEAAATEDAVAENA